MSNAVVARIECNKAHQDDPTLAIGTKVFVGDQELKMVQKIVLTAEVGQPFWKAEITVMVKAPEEVSAESQVCVLG